MALAIVPKPDTELPLQLPLPNPDTIPAWVHAALDRWDTRKVTYLGFEVLKQQYAELQSSYDNPMERDVFRKLRILAISWQGVNFRTYITSFEKMLLNAEIKALGQPMSTRRGDLGNQTDMDFILEFIQKELGGYGGGKRRKQGTGIVMGKRHILATLDGISAVYMACETLGVDVKIESSQREILQIGLQFKRSA